MKPILSYPSFLAPILVGVFSSAPALATSSSNDVNAYLALNFRSPYFGKTISEVYAMPEVMGHCTDGRELLYPQTTVRLKDAFANEGRPGTFVGRATVKGYETLMGGNGVSCQPTQIRVRYVVYLEDNSVVMTEAARLPFPSREVEIAPYINHDAVLARHQSALDQYPDSAIDQSQVLSITTDGYQTDYLRNL